MTTVLSPECENEFGKTVFWAGCDYLYIRNRLRPCSAHECVAFSLFNKENVFRNGVRTGESHYSIYWQKREGHADPYIPKEGDFLFMVAPKVGIKMPAIRQRYIHYIDKNRVYYYIAQPLGPSRLASAPLDSCRLWGFHDVSGDFTGKYISTYSRIMASQIALGVPVSGEFSMETRIKLAKEYRKNGPSVELFNILLGCLGYEHNDVGLFQYVEELPVTEKLDSATWARAVKYMGVITPPDETGNWQTARNADAAIEGLIFSQNLVR